ncbi:hypothetical protein OKHIL_23870 [Mycolicibacterium mageritense]
MVKLCRCSAEGCIKRVLVVDRVQLDLRPGNVEERRAEAHGRNINRASNFDAKPVTPMCSGRIQIAHEDSDVVESNRAGRQWRGH